MSGAATPRLRFGAFELDLEREELRRSGTLVHLPHQAFTLLALLAEAGGEVVSRETIRAAVWGEETHVDHEQGTNALVRQVRSALGDSATAPRFVETVPRKGYRLLAPVERLGAPEGSPPRPRSPHRLRRPVRAAGVVVALAVAATLIALHGPPAPTRPAAADGTPRLVVLPLTPLGGGASDEALADGLTEELITELSRRHGRQMGVIARTSAMTYKESDKDIATIARELAATHVLEGSLRRQGERVRITAQLIRAADQEHLWAGNYDRRLGDLLALQGEVAAKIARALALHLLPSPEPAPTRPEVYAAYLEGLAGLQRGGRDALSRAERRLAEATRQEAVFAPAWVALAKVRWRLLPGREGPRAARRALARALALDDAAPRAHLLAGKLRFYHDWDPEGARRAWERALHLDPGLAEAHHDLAAYHAVRGDHERALDSVERARALDPRAPDVLSDLGWYAYFARRHETAVERAEAVLEEAPDYLWARRLVLLATAATGDTATAARWARRFLERGGHPAPADDGSAVDAFWRWSLERHISADHPIPPTLEAVDRMALGEQQAAMDALEAAYRARSGWVLPFLPVYPLFDPLRGTPRFEALVERITGPARIDRGRPDGGRAPAPPPG